MGINHISRPAEKRLSVDPIGGSDEFWRDDADAIAEREKVDATGFRMPAVASSMPITSARSAAIASKAERQSRATKRFAFVASSVTVLAAIWWLIVSRPVVTLREFDQLAIGMSPEECERIVGGKGKRNVSLQTELPGFKTNGEDLQWVNADDSYAGVVFMNRKLHTKVQVRLK